MSLYKTFSSYCWKYVSKNYLHFCKYILKSKFLKTLKKLPRIARETCNLLLNNINSWSNDNNKDNTDKNHNSNNDNNSNNASNARQFDPFRDENRIWKFSFCTNQEMDLFAFASKLQRWKFLEKGGRIIKNGVSRLSCTVKNWCYLLETCLLRVDGMFTSVLTMSTSKFTSSTSHVLIAFRIGKRQECF